jgi:hypothetical protein
MFRSDIKCNVCNTLSCNESITAFRPVKLSEIRRRVNPRSFGSGEGILRYSGLFVDVVDEGLAVLGEAPKSAIYELLETDYAMQREDIPRRFVEFSKVLRDNIGSAVDPLLEFIVNGFFLKLHMEPPRWKDLNEGIQAVGQILRENFAEGTLSVKQGKSGTRRSEIQCPRRENTTVVSNIELFLVKPRSQRFKKR